MTRKLGYALLGVCLGLAAISSEAAKAGDDPSRQWHKQMADGYDYRRLGDHKQALDCFEKALTLAPTDDQAADALFDMAQTPEAQMVRVDAIAAYKRILQDYPNSRLVPQACHELFWRLHGGIPLVAPDTTPEQRKQAEKELAPALAISYLETGAAADRIEGVGPMDSYVLNCRLWLAGMYRDVGKIEASDALLKELVCLDPCQITRSNFVRPYRRVNGQPRGPDKVRASVLGVRRGAQDMMVRIAVVTRDPKASVRNLGQLIVAYPESEMVAMATKRIKEIRAKGGLPAAAASEEASTQKAMADLTALQGDSSARIRGLGQLIADHPESRAVDAAIERVKAIQEDVVLRRLDGQGKTVEGANNGARSQEEFFALLMDAIREGTPEARTKAVATLIGVRDRIESALVEAVEKANAGEAEDGTKAGALYLMGKFGSVRGRAILEAEKEFSWYPKDPFEGGAAILERYGIVASMALLRGAFSDSVRATPLPSPAFAMKDFPVLQAALRDIYSADHSTRGYAANTLLEWDRSVCEDLLSMLSLRYRKPLAPETRISAAFLLGEFRYVPANTALMENAGLTDPKKTRARYPQILDLDSGISEYPAIDALEKMGKRLSGDPPVDQVYLISLHSPRVLSDSDLERVILCLGRIDSEKVLAKIARLRKTYENLSELQMKNRSLTEEDRTNLFHLMDSWRDLVEEQQ